MKVLQGTITSLKTPQTARVHVVRSWQHPLYKKFVKRSKNYLSHYTDLQLSVGDVVEIAECTPISKTKHFKVVSKVAAATAETAQAAQVAAEKAIAKSSKAKTAKDTETKETT